MDTIRRFLALVCLAILAAGCATTGTKIIETSNQNVANAQTVTQFSELIRATVAFNADQDPVQVRVDLINDVNKQKLKMNEQEPVMARLFVLPTWSFAYSVRVTTSVLGGREDPAVFYPRVIMLDQDFKPLRNSTQTDFRFRSFQDAGALSATLFVNEQNSKERYLAVVEEPRKNIEEQLSMIEGQAPAPMILPLPLKIAEMIWVVNSTSNEPQRRLRASAAGVYELSFTPYKTRKLGEK